MKIKTPDPMDIVKIMAIYLMLSAMFRGFIGYRQHRLTALYGEFDANGINNVADFTDFIESNF